MRLFRRSKKRDAKTENSRTVHQEQSGRIFVSALCSTYENVFPQVRPLIDALKVVTPYGVSKNGAKLPAIRTPELALLDYPNAEMGRIEFMDLAFAMWLTESELNIHAWRNGRGKIYGYSILPPKCRVENGDGTYYFQTIKADGSQTNLSPDEVMTLRYSRNPAKLDQGVSPAQTVNVQAQIADMLYQYEAAFIENGAVPAYISFIRASTEEKFKETKRAMERDLQGPGNKGKTLFLWRQFLPNGQEKDQVEVKTIQPANSALAIKDIINIVKDDFNKAFGVSEFILGNDSSAKYDNAELSQQQFLEHRVKPALEAFWSQFQHELDRITGGLGYGIQWELHVPELTDRLKVKAEISKYNVENLTNLINSGSSPEAAVLALGLEEEWRDVAYGLLMEKRERAETVQPALLPQSSTDKPIAAQETATTKAEESATDQHVCRHHDHHNYDAKGDYVIEFDETEVREKAIYEELMELIQSAIAEITGDGTVLTEEQIEEIKEFILKELKAEGGLGANDSATQIRGYLFGAEAKEVEQVLADGGYELSEEFEQKISNRTNDLIERLHGDAKTIAKEVLNSAKENGYSASQIEAQLAKAMPRARAALIAKNETTYVFRAAGLENAKNLAKQYNLKMEKIWHCHRDDRACPICLAMDGETVGLDESFPNEIDGADGEQYGWTKDKWNDDGEVSSAHPRCRCYIQYKVIRGGYS